MQISNMKEQLVDVKNQLVDAKNAKDKTELRFNEATNVKASLEHKVKFLESENERKDESVQMLEDALAKRSMNMRTNNETAAETEAALRAEFEATQVCLSDIHKKEVEVLQKRLIQKDSKFAKEIRAFKEKERVFRQLEVHYQERERNIQEINRIMEAKMDEVGQLGLASWRK